MDTGGSCATVSVSHGPRLHQTDEWLDKNQTATLLWLILLIHNIFYIHTDSYI